MTLRLCLNFRDEAFVNIYYILCDVFKHITKVVFYGKGFFTIVLSYKIYFFMHRNSAI